MSQLVPQHLLESVDKILFITHLAIGDFTYWQNYFLAFAKKYPHIKIDIWIDEVRRTRCFWRWNSLQKYALYDWLKACPFVNKVYDETYSHRTFNKSIRSAQGERYKLVISLTTLRSYKYASLARRISPNGFIAGLIKKTSFLCFMQRFAYKKLDAKLFCDSSKIAGAHITDSYAQWMEQFFGIVLSKNEQIPFVLIPRQWLIFAKLRFLKWGIDKKSKEFSKVFFINAFAKCRKRCWPLKSMLTLMLTLKQQDQWEDVCFVINVPPEEIKYVQNYFNKHSINGMYIFSAQNNFFQLPAIISICDIVISVETSVMHLANALNVPVLALMRTKNPEWRPRDESRSIVIYAPDRQCWVKEILPDQVFNGVKELEDRLLQ